MFNFIVVHTDSSGSRGYLSLDNGYTYYYSFYNGAGKVRYL